MKLAKVEITLIVKPDCHLCVDALAVVNEVVARLQSEGLDVAVRELNMLDDPRLVKLYSEDIPVVLINGKRHSYWHVDAEKLSSAINKRSRPAFLGKLMKREQR